MLPSSEQKVYERDVPISVQPVRSRRHMKFPPVGNYADTSDFSTVYFTLTLPNETVTLHNLRIVCPIKFRFWDKIGKPVENMAIAPKIWLNNALRSIEFRCNGQSFTQFPENHKHAQACWQWSDPYEDSMQDSGSLLPVVGLYGDSQRTDAGNMGFAQRSRLFRSQRDERVVNAGAHTPLDGYSYSTELEIIPDMLMFQSFVRKCYSQDMSAAAYAYEMEINLNFRRDVENNNAFTARPKQSDQYIASRLGKTLDIDFFAQQQAIWREAFRIGNPLVDAVIDSELEHSGSSEMLDNRDTTSLVTDWDFFGETNYNQNATSTVVANTTGQANSATQTTIDAQNINVMDVANIQIGDFLVVADVNNIFTAQAHGYLDPENDGDPKLWQIITEIHDGATNTQKRFVHEALYNNAANRALCEGGVVTAGYSVDRLVRIYPGYKVKDPQILSQWRVGDYISLTKRGHELAPENFRLRNFDITSGYIWPDHPVRVGTALTVPYVGNTSWNRGAWVTNEYVKYGPISSAYSATRTVDRNNYGQTALTSARLNVLPHKVQLKTGDVIKLECEDSPYRNGDTRDFNGIWRVNVDAAPHAGNYAYPPQTGVSFDFTRYADGTDTGIDAFLAQDADDIDGIDDVDCQWQHMGGRVRLTKMKGSMVSPISYISGVWSQDPYIRVEAIQNDVMKDAYTFPMMKNEIYKETVRISATQPTIDGAVIPKKVTVRLKNIRLLEGFSSLHIYACLDEDLSRRLELYCSFGDCFFDISNVQVRIDNKFCLDGHEPEKWLFEQHKRVTESDMNFVQWKTKRKVISVDAETLALPTFFAGAARLYDCEVNFDVSYSRLFEELVKKIVNTRNTLVEGDTGADFVNSLNVSARCAIEYRRKAVKISREGDLEVQHNKIRQANSGLELGVQRKTILRSGGDPEAYIKSFDS